MRGIFCYKEKYFLVFFISVFLLAFLAVCSSADAKQTASEGGVSTNNYSYHDYSGNWSSPVYSYLVNNPDGSFTRIEAKYSSGKVSSIIREDYSSDYEKISSNSISAESCDHFGGFYSGASANYIVLGNENDDEDNSKVVFKVVKYSKNWVRQGEANLSNCNVTVPFDGGSLRMAEYNNMLYIRTARIMYAIEGVNHQSNFMIQVNTDTMTVTDYTNDLYTGNGYVSHSFNQFVLIDNTDIVALDHGDAHDRGLCINRYNGRAGLNKHYDYRYINRFNMMPFPGTAGANYTGCMAGGFECTESSYLTAGIYNETDKNKVMNLFVGAVNKNSLNDSGTQIRYYTDYQPKDKITVSNPHLVKISDSRLMLLWEEADNSVSNSRTIRKVHYQLLDDTGNKVNDSEEGVVFGRLSDCQPIVNGNKIIWYYTKNSSPVFCEIPTDGSQAEDNALGNEDYYYVKVKCNGDVLAKYAYYYGENVKLNAPAGSNGKGFDYWSSADVSGIITDSNREDRQLEFTMPGKDMNIEVAMADAYRVKVTNGKGAGLYVPGKTVEITGTPASGKYIDHWEATGITLDEESLSLPALSFTMPNNEVSLNGIMADKTDIYNAFSSNYLTMDYNSSVEYTGKPVSAQDLNIKITHDGKEEVEGINYNIEISDDPIYPSTYNLIWINGMNKYYGSRGVYFNIIKKNIANVDIVIPQVQYDGEIHNASINAMNGETPVVEGTDYYVASGGSAKDAGEYDVIINAVADSNYRGSTTKKFIIAAKPINDNDIEINDIDSVSYNGSAKTPDPLIKHGTKTLVKGTDYDLSYENNINAGTATVTITGKGNYSGSEEKEFEIEKKSLTADMLTLDKSSAAFNGANQKPEVTVSDGNAIKADDYVLTNDGGINLGKYNVTLTATENGNYKGSVTKEFEITPLALSDDMISISKSSFTYNGENQKPETVTVKSGILSLTENEDYTLVNDGGTNAGNYNVTINAKEGGNYSGSASKSFTIAPKTVTAEMIELNKSEFTYNGDNQKPAVTVKDGTNELVSGNDYTLINEGGMNTGTYKVSVSGKGNYGGTAEAGYQITAKPITDDSITVSVSDGAVYSGGQIKPSVSVKDGNNDLEKGKDYELEYSNNINAGNGANITVTGKGNYGGKRVESFSIGTADISNAAVTISDAGKKTVNGKDVFIATGDEIRPAIEVTFGANTLTEGTDYEISYDNNTAPGEAEIVLTGKGNYDNASTKTISFTIMSQEDYTAALNEEQDDPGNNDNQGGNTVSGDNNKPGSNNKPGNNENNKKQRLAQKGKDGTALGTGASAEAAEAAITSRKSDSDPAGALFGKIQLKAGKITKNLINVKWKKVSGAKTYTIYTNKCGAANKMIKLATTGSCSYNITKAAGKALKKGTYYKMIVVALDAKKNVVTTSKVIHVATAGGKVGNHKSVTVKAKIGKKTKKVKAVKVKVKKKIKLKAAAVQANKKLKVKKHIAVRFESTNKNIASVNKAGLVKGLKKGKCVVYAYAQNGVFAAVKITVK